MGMKYDLLAPPKPLGALIKSKAPIKPKAAAAPTKPALTIGQFKEEEPPPVPPPAKPQRKFIVRFRATATLEWEQTIDATHQKAAKEKAAQELAARKYDWSQAVISRRVLKIKPSGSAN